MASTVISLKMAVDAISMRLATSAWRWPKSWTPRSLPVPAVSRVSHPDAVAARVIGLVVVCLELDRHRVEAGGSRLVIA